MNNKVYNVVVLGNTGVGKSSLLNTLAGKENAFQVGNTAVSVTQLTLSKLYSFMGDTSKAKLRLVDTQGLSDTGGDSKDVEHIKNMVDSIKTLEYIDLFILCFDGTNPRYTSYARSTVSLFSSIFPNFLHHTVLVFNKWTTPNAIMLRELKSEYQELFNNEYKIKHIPCYFIDSNFNRKMLRDNDDGTQSERYLHPKIQERTKAQLNELMTFIVVKDSRCDVRNIRPRDTEKQALNKQLIQVTEQYENKFRDLQAQTNQQIARMQQASEEQVKMMNKQMERERERLREERAKRNERESSTRTAGNSNSNSGAGNNNTERSSRRDSSDESVMVKVVKNVLFPNPLPGLPRRGGCWGTGSPFKF